MTPSAGRPSIEAAPERDERSGGGNRNTEGDRVMGSSSPALAPPAVSASATSARTLLARTLLEAALGFARRGWRVIPLQWRCVEPDGRAVCSCWRRLRGIDCGRSSCKHPLWDDWPTLATSDTSLIRAWWRCYPLAGCGIATGWQSDGSYLIAIDEDGDNALAELAAANGETVPITWTQTTGRGRHFMFVVPPELLMYVDAIRNRTKLVDGLDVRAAGGLIVASPSVSLSGITYTITHDVEPTPMPTWLFWAIANKQSRRPNANASEKRPTEEDLAARGWPLERRLADGIDRCKRHPPAIEGGRPIGGDAMTWDLALQLVRGLVLPSDTAFDLLRRHYNPVCIPEWSERELQHKVDYAEDDTKVIVPWAYLLPPPNVHVRSAGTEGGNVERDEPTTLSPSMSSFPPPNTNTITVNATSAPREQSRETARIEFCGVKRTHNGKHALRVLVLDGSHTGLEKPWWLDWPANERSANKWRHIAIALGLDEIRDPLRDTRCKRVCAELVRQADGSVEIRRVWPLP